MTTITIKPIDIKQRMTVVWKGEKRDDKHRERPKKSVHDAGSSGHNKEGEATS